MIHLFLRVGSFAFARRLGVGRQRHLLRARGIEHTPYLYSAGLLDRAWSQYRELLETHWEAYVHGAMTRTEAIARTVAALSAR